MADGAVRPPPYRGIVELLYWVRSNPGRWHQLDGECSKNGVDLRRISFERFLNVIYAEAVKPFGPQHEAERANLDSALGVSIWPIPGRGTRRRVSTPVQSEVPAGAPTWWHGDEEASQSFLREMGVQ